VIFVPSANEELIPGGERNSAALANKTNERHIYVLEYTGQVDE
jgi:hypothetical protein